MRSILLAVLVASAPYAIANPELEQVGSASLESQLSKEQVELAQKLPKTFVIRENLKTKEVEVIAVKEELKPGQKITKVKFEQLAQNSELKGLVSNSSNELDATSSTSSWWAVGGWGGRGWGGGYGGGYGGWGRPAYPVAYGYNMGYAAGSYGGNYCGGGGYGYGYGCGVPQYYPQVYCGGYGYPYQPYYGYAAGGYQYTYSGWGGY